MGTNQPTLRRPVALVKAVYGEMKAEDVPFMAGAVAYQAFVSLLPLLVLLVVLTATIGDEALVDRLLAATEGQVPSSTQDLIVGTVRGAAGNAGASIIGVVTLAFGAFKIFRGLDKAFAELFDTERTQSLVDGIRDGGVVFGAVVLAVGAMLAAGSVFALVPNLPFGGLLPPVALVVGLMLAFLPMYYVFPDVDLSVREVLPGVVLAAVGWAALEAVFQVYVTYAGQSDAYGVFGAILVLVTWLYFGGLLLLVGATVNAVLAGRAGRVRRQSTSDASGADGDGDESADAGERSADDGERAPVRSVRDFERELDDLLERARRNGVPESAVLADFRRRVRTPADVWGPDEGGRSARRDR